MSIGTYTTGNTANQLGLAQHWHNQQWLEQQRDLRRARRRRATHLDPWIRIILAVNLSGAVVYAAMQSLALPSGWAVGTAALLAVVFYGLLLGPLQFLVTAFKWMVAACALGWAAYALVRFLAALHTASH